MLTAAPLERDWILGHVPHGGRMCLLDAVAGWDGGYIECTSHSHRAADHPLRAHGRLGAACGVEYAAQAMALHGVLLGRGATVPGLLASVRGLQLQVGRLDDVDGPLTVRCERLGGGDRGLLYHFRLLACGASLLSGRATIVLGALPGATP